MYSDHRLIDDTCDLACPMITRCVLKDVALFLEVSLWPKQRVVRSMPDCDHTSCGLAI